MHPHSSAVLREMHLQKENDLRRAELAKQMEFAQRSAPTEAGVPARRTSRVAFARLTGWLPGHWIKSPRPMEPSNS